MKIKQLFFLITIILISLSPCYGEQSPIEQFEQLNTSNKCRLFIELDTDTQRENFEYFETQFIALQKKITNKKDLQNINITLGLIDKFKNNDVQSVLKLNQILIEKSPTISDDYLMVIYLSLQESYLKLNIFAKVYELNSKIQELIDKGVSYPIWNYNIQSRLYLKMKKYDEAIQQLKSEIEQLKTNPKRDSLIIPSATNDLGLYYYIVKDYKNGEYYFKKSLQLATKALDTLSTNYSDLYLTINNNLARLKVSEGKNNEAIAIITQQVFPKIKKSNEVYVEASYILANAYLKNKDFKNFEETSTFNELHQEDHINYKFQYLSLKIQYLIAQEKYKEALNLYKQFYELRANEFDNNNTEQFKSAEINYLLLENENTLRAKNNEIEDKHTRTLFFILILLAAIISIILFFYINIYKKKQQIEKMNSSILIQKQEIENSLKEKEILLKEIHHRVKNNLQIISSILDLQLINTSDSELKEVLREGQNRIQTIALIHKNMYQKELYSEVNFKDYTEELVEQIQSTLAYQKNIDIKYYVDSILLPLDYAIPLSLIITEIITNSFKHAFKELELGEIFITFHPIEKNTYELKIKDNGVGFDISAVNKDNSIGLDLIEGLTEQINGNLKIDSNKNEGTTITICFTTV